MFSFTGQERDIDRTKATLIGFASIVFWSALVGFIKSVSDRLGAVGGAAVIHTVGSLMLLAALGFPNLRTFPKKYLVIGTVLFCIYEISFMLAVSFAQTPQQTLEVNMVNYLWPSLIILFAIIFNKQKANFLIVPGMILSFTGVLRVLGGEEGSSFPRYWRTCPPTRLAIFLPFAARSAGRRIARSRRG